MLSASIHQASAQETIYSQNFTGANGAMSGLGWGVVQSDGCGFSYDFGIESNVFLVRRARGFDCGCNGPNSGNNQNIVEFGPIDISNHCDIDMTLTAAAQGDLECGDGGAAVPYYCDPSNFLAEGHDMMWIEVIIDGTAQTMKYYCGNSLIVDNAMTGMNGNSMTIRITAGTQALSESFTVDNILVEGTPAATIATTISVTPSTTICPGQFVTLTATGPEPYLWNTGASSASITVDPSTTTTYDVVTGSGCTQGMASQQIRVPSPPQARAGNNTSICQGQTITLSASGGGTYKWSSGHMSANASVVPTSTTTYTVTVTSSAGCTDTDDVTITVNNVPNVRAGDDQAICDGDFVTLTATGASTYVWSNDGATSPSISFRPGATGTYTVTGTRNGCSDSDDVVVVVNPKPIASISGVEQSCAGDPVILTAAGDGSYLWNTTETDPMITVNPNVTSNYTLSVTKDGCTGSATKTINVTPKPQVELGSDMAVCEDETTTITATGADTYVWDTGETSPTLSVSPTSDTMFTVTGTLDGCTASDDINITIQPKLIIDLGEDYEICTNSETQLSITEGLTYLWSNDATTATINISPSSTEIYAVTATDGTCTAIDDIQIAVRESFLLEASNDTTICRASTVTLSAHTEGAIAYSWSTGSKDPEITLQSSVDTTLSVTANDGLCEVTEVIQVTIDDINIELAPAADISCSGDEVQIDVLTNGIVAWPDGINTSSRSFYPTMDTTIAAVATSTLGCIDRDDVSITVHPLPTLAIDGATYFCSEGSTTISATSGLSEYNWSDDRRGRTRVIDQAADYTLTGVDDQGCASVVDITISEQSLPQPEIIGTRTFCPGSSTELSINETYTALEWEYDDIISEDPTIDITKEGTVFLLVEDEFGCLGFAEAEIIANADLNPVIIGDVVLCQNTNGTLSIQGEYDHYIWSTGDETNAIDVSSADTYSVTVSTDDGCSGSATSDVQISEAPMVSFRNNLTFCNTPNPNRSEPTSINLDTIFDQINVDGFWSTSSPDIDLSNLPIINLEGISAGRYELSFNSTNAISPCDEIVETVMLDVQECQCPDVQLQTIAPLCNISDQLDLSLIQSSDFDGSWQIVEGPTATLPSITDDTFNATNIDAGSYKLEFRLNDGIAPLGCDASKSVDLEVTPHIGASIDMIQAPCNGAAGTFQVNLYGADSYDVAIQYGPSEVIGLNNIEDGHTFDMNLDEPTTFTFSNISSNIITCGFQSDLPSYTFEPTTLDAELELSKTYGPYGVSCNESTDGAAMIRIQTGTAPYEYLWSDGSTAAEIEDLPSGKYGVSVNDAAGCSFTSSIEIEAPPMELVAIDAQDPICGQGPGRLALSPTVADYNTGWEIYLDGILQSQTEIPTVFNGISAGSHTLEAVSDEGCIEIHTFETAGESDFEIGLEDRTIALGQSTVLFADFQFPAESITWSPGIYLLDSTSTFVFVQQPHNSTTYTVTITGIDGCIYKDFVRVNVEKERVLAVPTGFTANGDGTNDSFIIHAKSDVVLINSVSVFDRWGEEVFFARDIAPNTPIDWDWTWRNEPLPAGQYIWKANATFLDNERINLTDQFYIIR